jgi:hypothetical protein
VNYLTKIARSEGDPKIVRTGPSSRGALDSLSVALGWFSIGLGLTELMAPGRITRALGMEGQEALVRAYGAREIASGILSLSVDKQAGLWSRVAGDGLDTATVLTAWRDDNPKRDTVSMAIALLAGVAILDLVAAQGVTTRHAEGRGNRRSYRDRTGFPRGVEAARGAARAASELSQDRSGRAMAAAALAGS